MSNFDFMLRQPLYDIYLSIKVFPIGVDPVKPTFLMSGCSDIACPIDDPGPGRILMTPGGKPALTVNSANFSAVNGVTCEKGIS